MLIIASVGFFTSLGTAGETKAERSDVEEDAFILHKYSLIDAKRERSAKITESDLPALTGPDRKW
jgi:hypothetical protein